MEIDTIRHMKALTDLNAAFLTGLETAVFVIENWDNIQDQKKEGIFNSLKLLVENNREFFLKK